jgi:clan AA aspartic protease
MGQVTMRVRLTNAREYAMYRLGRISQDEVHTVEVEALIDTGTLRSVVPPAIARALDLTPLDRSETQMADGRWGETDVSEPVRVTLSVGVERTTTVPMLIMGETVLFGAIVLEGMDLLVDCARQKLVPNVGTFEQPVFRV